MNDVISRQAVIDACEQSINILEAVDRIMDLPSIEQEPILDKIRAEIDGIEINGQVDIHTSFVRTGDHVKQMALDIIDKYTKGESL